MARSHERDQQSRYRREDELADLRASCAQRHAEHVAECRTARGAARARTRDALAQEKELRRIEREQFRAGRMTAAENDSLALHDVEPDKQDLFWEMRHLFSYDLPPDHRSVLFAEWVGEHPNEVIAWYAEQAEGIDWAQREAEFYDEVPF